MKLIRQNCFETNSSSCHSISVANNPISFGTILPTDKENLVIELDLGQYEFGWEQEIYGDPTTKLAYLLLDCNYDENLNSDNAVRIRKVVKEHTGCTLHVIREDSPWGGKKGYIDHQSSGTAAYLAKDEHLIKNFVFGSNSYLETDNDNH